MSAEIFKKTPQEKNLLRVAKRNYRKACKQSNPNWTKHKAGLGLRANSLNQIKVLLDMAETIKLHSAEDHVA